MAGIQWLRKTLRVLNYKASLYNSNYENIIDERKSVRYNGGKKEVILMNAVNATSARKNLYRLISDVNSNSTPITITNSRGKNAVLLSEDDWNAIQETIYLNSVPGMVNSILKEEPLEEREIYNPDEEW